MTEHPIKVLLVDDQRIVGETIRRMLAEVTPLEFRFCADAGQALTAAMEFQPTVILQDLILPGVNGLDLVRAYRAEQSTRDIPLIVLSTKEEALTKAESFAAGANDYLVKLPDKLELIARIRYHSSAYTARLERDEAYRAIEAQQRLIAQEIAEAAAYVRSLLPAPMTGEAVRADWQFITSSTLGGDAFGYHWLDGESLAIYLLDVCGHGVGSALLSVSALTTIRNGTLRNTDYRVPSQVLQALNRAFPMGERDGKFFTLWYGVWNTATRELVWSAGGHPPAIAVLPDGTTTSLAAPGLMLGAMAEARYTDHRAELPAGTRLCVFSDGCYEVMNAADEMMGLDRFVSILAEDPDPLRHVPAQAQQWQGRADFDDDFSLVVLHL